MKANKKKSRRLRFGGVVFFIALFLSACSESAGDAYQRGIKHWNEGQHFEAIGKLRVITRNHPSSEYAPKALLKVAQIQAYDLMKYDEAEDTYQLYLKLYPQSQEAGTALEELTTLLFEKKRDYVRAINECQRYIDSFPTSPKVPLMHIRIMRSYLQMRNFAQSRIEAALFLRKFPNDAMADEVAYEVARSFFIEGKPDVASKEAQKFLEERPSSPFSGRARFLKAAALEDSDRLAEALEAYTLARDSHPEPAIVDEKIKSVADRLRRKHN